MRNRFLAGKRKAANNQGFSLPEILAATTIVTSLCSIAIPTYIEQQKIACQREPESIIAQVMTQTQAYNDEYGDLAQGWSDLDKIATLMTASGPANGNSFNTIELPSCDYTLRGSLAGNLYTFEAERGAKGIAPIDENIAEASESNQPIDGEPEEVSSDTNNYNVAGCLNIATGASDIQSGNGSTSASTAELTCS